MKIVNIVPGFGGTFYCGNCLRDSGFVKALRDEGYDTQTIPIYLPLSMDHVDRISDTPVFYGAIAIYLKQKFKLLRHMPQWMENFFNSAPFMRIAAKQAGSTRAAGMEAMTISMLQGHEGYQAEELDMLIGYLKEHVQPDIVHLSNALLLGLAKKVKEELDCGVVCTLQDEDVWIDAMRPQYVDKLWNLMSEKSEDVDLFLPVSHYFGKLMQGKMMLPEEKIHPVHIGIDLSAYAFKLNKNNPPVLGYLSRLNEENGLEIIIDAFIILKSKFNHSELKLKLTGGETGDDKSFIRKQKKKLKKAGFLQEIEILDAYEGQDKIDFLQSLTLLSVPVLKGEAFGLYQLESIACGTPIVQPALGAFPEIIDETQGGLYYSPNSPEALAQKLDLLLRDPDKLEELAIKGRKNLEDKFNMKQQVDKMITAYTKALDEKKKKV